METGTKCNFREHCHGRSPPFASISPSEFPTFPFHRTLVLFPELSEADTIGHVVWELRSRGPSHIPILGHAEGKKAPNASEESMNKAVQNCTGFNA
ncbi:MAG: hypothetical protein ACFCBU_18055 [Cyanophyceae cyanobacterium]